MPSTRPPLPGGPYLVVGLARSGLAAALLLHRRGEQVIALDDAHPDVGRLLAAGVEVVLDDEGARLAARARTLVKSPGVPGEAPVVRAARERGLAILGEAELAWRLLPNPFLAVTGTNGKTTTAELLGHLHRAAGVEVVVAGNVGLALSTLVGELDPDAVVVAELSSFQLEDTEAFTPEAAVLLNLSADHVDRHGTFAAYAEAKLNAFRRQRPEDVAVAPVGQALPGAARRVTFGPGGDLDEREGALWWQGERLLGTDELRLPGAHNRANAAAAAAVALARGLPAAAVIAGLRSFAGVAHRLETIGEHGGVRYVNDSKATNVASTLVALDAFPGVGIHLILGGRGKGQDFSALRAPIAASCRASYVIGEDAERIAAALEGLAVERCDTLERAVARARAAAVPGELVLLSPACASYDQFLDFEARGQRFRALVEQEAREA